MPAPPSSELGLIEIPLALSDLPARQANILAFDTSTECLALAVCGPASAITLRAAGGAAASATLLPHALRLLARLGLELNDLDAIAFGCGPGAFTGLRTSCAVAQGLGLGLGLPVLPLDSLLLVAEDARLQQWASGQGVCEVAVAMDARMNEVYAARYAWRGVDSARHPHDGTWQLLQAPQLLNQPAWAQAWAGLPLKLVAGSAFTAFADRLPPLPQALCLGVERNRAAALLQLALRAWNAGQAIDAAQALPIYVRDKVAQTTHERELARAVGTSPAASATPDAAARSQWAPGAGGQKGLL